MLHESICHHEGTLPQSMKLYHFTAVPLAEGILSDAMRIGHVPLPNDEPLTFFTWFTTSPYPEGTGVPQQSVRLTAHELDYVDRVEGNKPTNSHSHDKSKVRIMVDSADLTPFDKQTMKGLISFVGLYEFLGYSPMSAKRVGLSAYMDLSLLSPEALQRELSCTDNTEEHCWYVHRGRIPADLIREVSYRTDEGYVPYDFESHGRKDMEGAGFACASAPTNAALSEILAPLHGFENAKATLLCLDPDKPVFVTVRGSGVIMEFDIETGKPVSLVSANYPFASITQFILDHREEWLECRDRALAACYVHHPEWRPD